jgi:hypothetical protein
MQIGNHPKIVSSYIHICYQIDKHTPNLCIISARLLNSAVVLMLPMRWCYQYQCCQLPILGKGEYMRVRVKSSRKENMSLEGLGCLESLVPSKPSEPTLTSNQHLHSSTPTQFQQQSA